MSKMRSSNVHMHVLSLCAFLREYAAPESLSLLLERCRAGHGVAAQHRGDDERVLLEVCFTWEPVCLLAELFSTLQLRAAYAAARREEIPSSVSFDDAARGVLLHLGFPSTEPQQSLEMVRQFVRESYQRVERGASADGAAEVANVARRLERLFDVLLRFLCQSRLHVSVDEWLVRTGTTPTETTRPASLGTLLERLGRLGTEIARHLHDPVAQRIATEGLLPPMNALVRLRNDFTHDRPVWPGRAEALTFLNEATLLLDHLHELNVYPRVVTVRSVATDAFNRCSITVCTPEGTMQEMVSDMDLRPGQVCYVQPLSNPVWVFPVLVVGRAPKA